MFTSLIKLKLKNEVIEEFSRRPPFSFLLHLEYIDEGVSSWSQSPQLSLFTQPSAAHYSVSMGPVRANKAFPAF